MPTLYLSPAAVAERLGVNVKQVYRLIESGELAAIDVGLGTQRRLLRVAEDEYERFVRHRARCIMSRYARSWLRVAEV